MLLLWSVLLRRRIVRRPLSVGIGIVVIGVRIIGSTIIRIRIIRIAVIAAVPRISQAESETEP